ncbi:hypothetical protein [Streptomyces sp. NPDC001222]|uniref:hypothetical protein n=1 Tax=Streptomyces sp. NPDC001222 TaxID=3364548 RepID=UPI0036C3E5DB
MAGEPDRHLGLLARFAAGPGEVGDLQGVVHQPVYGDTDLLVCVLRGFGWQEVQRAALVFAPFDACSGQAAMGGADGAVEDDEGPSIAGRLDETSEWSVKAIILR